MRVFPVKGYTQNQQKTFKGETKYLDVTHGMYNSTVHVRDYKAMDSSGGLDSYFKNNDCTDKVKNRPYSTVEKTLNTYHAYPTREVYYADPEEVVTTAIKEQADYIVYDNKPPYPVAEGYISENYFGKLRHNFVKDFDEVRNYHYRLEMADAKTADKYRRNILANVDVNNSKEKFDYYNHRIGESKENQRLAQACIDIYNEAGDLRYKKERAEDEVANLNYQIAELNKKIDKEERNIKVETAILGEREKESALADLNLKDYKKINTRNEKLKEIKNAIPKNEENEYHLDVLLEDATKLSEKLNTIKKDLRDSIYKSKVFLAQAPEKMKELMAKKAAKEASIEEIKGKLIPLFDKLKNHYNVHNLLHR